MMRRTCLWALTLVTLGLLLSLAACGRAPVRRTYYTMTYPMPSDETVNAVPVTLRIKEMGIPATYRRAELVFRPDVHEIRYDRQRRWSERPQQMITELIREHIQTAGVVTQVTSSAGERDPHYVLTGHIDALEVVEEEGAHFARVAMTLWLIRANDEAEVWRYSFDQRRPASTREVRASVRAMSEVLSVEMRKVTESIHDRMAKLPVPSSGLGSPPAAIGPTGANLVAPRGQGPPALALPARTRPKSEKDEVRTAPPPPPEVKPGRSVGTFKPDPASPLNQHPQLVTDRTPVPPGRGALFLPALSTNKREPSVVIRKDGKPFGGGPMGRRIVLPPGTYDIRFGSGPTDLQLRANVEVKEGMTTVVPATWSAIQVRVVDEQFIPFRGTYEVINALNRNEYGLGFGADELLGEQLRTFILPPGLYKIIQAGGTYRDRTNFVTVRLLPGEFTPYTLVIDDIGDFRGAGILVTPVVQSADPDAPQQERWLARAIIGGDLELNNSNQVGDQSGTSLSASLFLDSQVQYQDGPHLSVTRLEAEEEQLRPQGQDEFQNINDRLFLHTIYTYRLVPWFGPYGRVGVETQILPRYQNYDTPRDVTVVDEDGNPVEVIEDTDRARLADPFSPVQPLEGAGGNFIVAQNQIIDLNFRMGFGARQTFARGLLAVDDSAENQLRQVQSSALWGVEGTVVGVGRLTRFVTVSSEFDGLLALSSGDSSLFRWRNQFSVRLASFVSLIYRLNMLRDPNLGLGDETRTEHDVQLRFSYNLF